MVFLTGKKVQVGGNSPCQLFSQKYALLNYFGFSKLTSQDESLEQSEHWIYQLTLLAWQPENSLNTGSSPPFVACCESCMLKHHVHSCPSCIQAP